MPSSSSSSESSSSSDDAGEREYGSLPESREKSSTDAGSEGEVMISGDGRSGRSVEGVRLVFVESWLSGVSKEFKVGNRGTLLEVQ